MKKFYGPIRKAHRKLCVDLAKKGDTDLIWDLYSLDIERMEKEGDRKEVTSKGKRSKRKAVPKPLRRPVQKPVVLDDDDEEFTEGEEHHHSEEDDDFYAPSMKERKRVISLERRNKAESRSMRTSNDPLTHNKVKSPKSSRDLTRIVTLKLPRDKLAKVVKPSFKRAVKRDGRRCKKILDTLKANRPAYSDQEKAVRKALRRRYWGFPQGQKGLNLPEVDETLLDYDTSDSSDSDSDEPTLDSIYIKCESETGQKFLVPSLEKAAKFIQPELRPNEPILFPAFCRQHGLFDRSLETGANQEEEYARRWRVLKEMETSGFIPNLHIFNVLLPYQKS